MTTTPLLNTYPDVVQSIERGALQSAHVVIDYNIHGSMYVEISNYIGDGMFLGFCRFLGYLAHPVSLHT